ncbi:MAG: hypothetical protein DWH81_12500 [Planctomycetota bacterium]|nr:MAG: hypothetical protein DWH81_12500 [Planctomycetota bacterium]
MNRWIEFRKESRKRQRPESNRNNALAITQGAHASDSLTPRQPRLAESLTRPHGTHAMQRTMFLAITLLALLTRISWAQTPTAEPAATPPAPPEATATDSQEIASESDKSAEIPPLMIEEPKADDPRVEEFQQIIQLLVNRNIAKVVPPTDPWNSTESHSVIAFSFLPRTNRATIRSLLYEISQINIPKLQVTIRNQMEKPLQGSPPTEVYISKYESLERQHVVALWKLFKQHKVIAFFKSGKKNAAYSFPPFPEPVYGAETTEQINVENGKAQSAFMAIKIKMQEDGPPFSLGYDEKTNSLLVDRRDGVSNEVKKLLDQFYPKPKPAPPVAEIMESPAPAEVETNVEATPVDRGALREEVSGPGVSGEDALGLPASAIPGKVWVSSGTVIVAIADDGKSASAYCEQHPTWVAVQLDSTIEAKPLPIVGAKVATIQHGNQCHAYSPRHRVWTTLTLTAGEEAVPSVGALPVRPQCNPRRKVNMSSRTNGESGSPLRRSKPEKSLSIWQL